MLGNTPPIPGCGAGRSEAEWHKELAALRTRLMALSAFEFRYWLMFAEYGDLVGLVIAPPADTALLERLCSLLDEPVGKALARDCRRLRDSWPGSDLACATCERISGQLELFEIPRASAERIEAIRAMTLKLLMQPTTRWFSQRSFFLYRLFPLLTLTGGLEGDLGRWIESISREEEWNFLESHYPDHADEPLFAGPADQCEQGLTALLAGRPWTPETLIDHELELARAEIEMLLDYGHGSEEDFAPALPGLFNALDEDATRQILENIGTFATFQLVRFLGEAKDAALARQLLSYVPECRKDLLISALVSWCETAEAEGTSRG